MPLTVRLAGYNLDADLIADVSEILRLLEFEVGSLGSSSSASDLRAGIEHITNLAKSRVSRDALTPETISAAYARISRDPSHVTELRQSARFAVARARKSNESIIFGLGHASVAEHAAFNFDVSGVSRLASEELQAHRLLSFTEKSQRYISIGSHFVIPPEAQGTELEQEFQSAIPRLFRTYDELTGLMAARYLSEAQGDLTKTQLRDLENRAKEDTRYLLPLACETQMGMTMNARNVEHVVCELSDHPLQELRDLGRAISDAVGNLAPSLVKYTVRGEFPRANREQLASHWKPTTTSPAPATNLPRVRVTDYTPSGEERVLRGIAFSSSQLPQDLVHYENNPEVWRTIFHRIGPFDSTFREFELASMTFEAEVSASCFAQLKRHRMMTLLSQPYDIHAGAIVPPSISEHGHESAYLSALESALSAAHRLSARAPQLTPYLLTNAHRKRVVMHVNARELYHIARLRCDAHAQWEIRSLGEQMITQAAKIWPNMMALACGKDKFKTAYERYFGTA